MDKIDKKDQASVLKPVVAVLAVLVVIAFGAAIYFYQQSTATQLNPQADQDAVQADADALLVKVGKLMVLPADEKPVIATVTDPSKLKDQPFFAQTEVGDRVIIYPQARKAILYNPKLDKIIEVAPLNIGQQEAAAAATNTAPAPQQ